MLRPILVVHSTSAFERAFRELPRNIQSLAEKKDNIFRQNAFDNRLRTHKLRGELEGYWSYSVDQKYRVLFRFVNNDEVLYYDVGTHDIYR